MSYFAENYLEIRFPIKPPTGEKGLRRAQLGAIHAIASHFSLRNDPALVSMPTGSGKTLVLMVAAFLLRAKRVLVVTPSQLVRDQIAEGFATLGVLKFHEVVRGDLGTPKVHQIRNTIRSAEEWEQLREFDVVVAIPSSASPAIDGIPFPPEDLFDVILVDEAHHSPARTWNELFNSFPSARRVLVTATPFRRDRRQIKGKFVFVYPLREAYHDEVFGKIEFNKVETQAGEHPDVAIAKAAERVLKEDQDLGFRHYLMVRTDTRDRANELATVYADNTGLRLRVIHSGHSFGRVKKAIEELKGGELDGVICVNMMGEGFDFPNLKVAAVHAPHKSLAVTLQFIGRFARTNADDIGSARFVAIPHDIEIERQRLYDEDAVWQELVINLSRARIEDEVSTREALEGFQPREENDFDLEEGLGLPNFKPYFHVKVYRMGGAVDMMREPQLPPGYEIAYRWDNLELNSTVFVVRQESRPKWATTDHFSSRQHHLFVVYFDQESKLLFINSTIKLNEVYELVARSFTEGSPRILPLNQINKVLLGFSDPRFYNIGMANRTQSASVESYRILTGPSAEKALSESDGQLYHRGHAFGGDAESTIGFSSASKVWSNAREFVPKLIEWCKVLAGRLTSGSNVVTHSPLDYLDVGRTISELPSDAAVLGALWDHDVFKNPPRVGYQDDEGRSRELSMLDLELRIDPSLSTANSIRVRLECQGFTLELDFVLDGESWSFRAVDESQLEKAWVLRAHVKVSFLDYLSANPLTFFLSDFSSLYGTELFEAPNVLLPSVEEHQFVTRDWLTSNVDIRKEFGDCDAGKVSIHTCLEDELPKAADFVFYDHGSGEVADFLTFEFDGEELTVAFFHCKGSSGDAPSERTKDYYEVCCQVVKSLRWIENDSKLVRQLEHREKVGSRFIKGDLAGLKNLIEQTRRAKKNYRLVVVQPGISKVKVDDLGPILAMTSDFVTKSRGQRFEVWCSD